MRRVYLGVGVVVVLGVAVGLACSDKQPPIDIANPIDSANPDKPPELPPMAAPDKFDPAAKAIVDDAIKAHTGGKPDLLQKLKSVEFSREGQGLGAGRDPVPQKWLVHAAWPNRIRFRFETPGQFVVHICRNGDKVWRASETSPKEELPDDYAGEIRLDASFEWLWMLFPLTEPSTVVALAPEAVANDRPAVGVRVWAQGVTDAILHFDKETKLLARVTFDGRENRRKVTKELLIPTTKAFHGVVLPDKMILKADGNLLAEWNMTALDFRPTIDPKVFDNP
jgi:hypothetical protein